MSPSFFEWYIAANVWFLIPLGLISLTTVAAFIMAFLLSGNETEIRGSLLKCQWILETSYSVMPALGALGTIWKLWMATSTRAQWESASRNLAPILQQAMVPLGFAVVIMLIAAAGHAVVRYRLIAN